MFWVQLRTIKTHTVWQYPEDAESKYSDHWPAGLVIIHKSIAQCHEQDIQVPLYVEPS